jgi:putative tricarboxylic transport membrane protein
MLLDLNTVWEGAQLLLSPGVLLAIPLGCIVGIMLGAVPGMTGSSMLAIFLPIVIFIDPMPALAFMLAMFISDNWGGAFSGIVMNIPTSGSSTATAIDGYALTKQGRAGEALAVGRSAAFVGGIFGAVVLMFLAPTVAHWAVRFGPAEYLALAVFGVTMVSAVSTAPVLMALMSAWVGFLLSTVGQDIFTGYSRFTFGLPDLWTGIDLVWVILGLFAIVQAYDLLMGRDERRQYKGKIDVPWRAAWPVLWKRRRVAAAGALIGTGVGITPGAGGTVAAWIAYNTAQRISKDPTPFGKGNLDGVIAPEAAGDGAEGGSLVPTMTLGIPGGGSTAVLLAGFTLAGLRPGPQMFQTQAPQAVSIMLMLIVANILFLFIAVFAMRVLVLILKVDPRIWPPMIFVVAIFGAFSVYQSMFGAYVMLVIGIAMFALKLFGFPQAPMLLGFILGPIVDSNWTRIGELSHGNMMSFVMERPVALVIFALAVAAVAFDVRRQIRDRRRTKAVENAV